MFIQQDKALVLKLFGLPASCCATGHRTGQVDQYVLVNNMRTYTCYGSVVGAGVLTPRCQGFLK